MRSYVSKLYVNSGGLASKNNTIKNVDLFLW